MGVMTMAGIGPGGGGGGFSTSWFTANSPSGSQLGAIVLWRQKVRPGREPQRVRFPFLRMLLMRLFVQTRILPKLWPRGFHALMFGSFREADAMRAEMMRHEPIEDGWTSASGSGKDRINFDARRRVVGFRGRVFGPPPAGQALVLLLEDDDSAPDGVRVTERAIQVPPSPPMPSMDKSLPKEERGRIIREHHAVERALWNTALEADPEYRRFIETKQP